MGGAITFGAGREGIFYHTTSGTQLSWSSRRQISQGGSSWIDGLSWGKFLGKQVLGWVGPFYLERYPYSFAIVGFRVSNR